MTLPSYLTENEKQEIYNILHYAIQHYGRHQFMVLKNILTAAIWGSMVKGYISFGDAFRYIKEQICVLHKKPEDVFNMKFCVTHDYNNNTTLYGINMTTILYKTPYQVFCQITDQKRIEIKKIFQQYQQYFKYATV